jgi:multiple sugar transport system permease protein
MAEQIALHETTIQQPRRPRRRNKLLGKVLGYSIVSLVALFFILPVVWMFFTAFKSDQDVFRFPPTLLPHAVKYVDVDGETLPLYTVCPRPTSRPANWR